MTAEDWPQVSRIYNQSIISGGATFNTRCPVYADWDKKHLEDCRYVIIAEGKITGWCAISPTSAMEAYRGVVEVSIYIDSEYCRKGLGTVLLRYLCSESEKKGYWTLYSAIFASNAASIALHGKCGFRTVGYREKIARDKYGQWLDTVIMERRSRKIM